MKNKLEKLATIKTGLPNSKMETLDLNSPPQETYSILQGDSIGSSGEIIEEKLKKIKKELSFAHHLLQAGDVVILTRGSAIRAAYITEKNATLNLIPSATITVVRPKNEELLGEVLVAFINSPKGQAILNSLQQGVALPSLPAKQLRELEISIPHMQTQQKIAELFYATMDCYLKTLALAEQQKTTANALMINLMEESKND